MNFIQTKQALQYLWGTHPAAPRFDDTDKNVAAISYFRVLYMYSLPDVLDAIDRACRKSPSFIPSAFEVEENVYKTLDVDSYIDKEKYKKLDQVHHEYKDCGMSDYYREAIAANCATDPAIKKVHQQACDAIQERIDIDIKLHNLYRQAEREAEIAYDARQKNISFSDLKQLGFGG